MCWGAGVDASFADPQSWDASDRFEYVETNTTDAIAQAMGALAGPEPNTVASLTLLIGRGRLPLNYVFPRDWVWPATSQLLRTARPRWSACPSDGRRWLPRRLHYRRPTAGTTEPIAGGNRDTVLRGEVRSGYERHGQLASQTFEPGSSGRTSQCCSGRGKK